jgi:hypothetical protein
MLRQRIQDIGDAQWRILQVRRLLAHNLREDLGM